MDQKYFSVLSLFSGQKFKDPGKLAQLKSVLKEAESNSITFPYTKYFLLQNQAKWKPNIITFGVHCEGKKLAY